MLANKGPAARRISTPGYGNGQGLYGVREGHPEDAEDRRKPASLVSSKGFIQYSAQLGRRKLRQIPIPPRNHDDHAPILSDHLGHELGRTAA